MTYVRANTIESSVGCPDGRVAWIFPFDPFAKKPPLGFCFRGPFVSEGSGKGSESPWKSLSMANPVKHVPPP